MGDEALFRQAVGVTIHYIDAGIDTGHVIQTERLTDPFAFENIWELIVYVSARGDDIYVQTARNIIENPDIKPAGIATDPTLQSPVYYRKEFTPERKEEAERQYLQMRRRCTS